MHKSKRTSHRERTLCCRPSRRRNFQHQIDEPGEAAISSNAVIRIKYSITNGTLPAISNPFLHEPTHSDMWRLRKHHTWGASTFITEGYALTPILDTESSGSTVTTPSSFRTTICPSVIDMNSSMTCTLPQQRVTSVLPESLLTCHSPRLLPFVQCLQHSCNPGCALATNKSETNQF